MNTLAARLGKYLHRDQKSLLLKIGREAIYQAKRPYRYARRATIDYRIGRPQGRSFASGVHPRLMISMMQGYLKYRYKDIPMLKHPLDIVLYLLLLQDLKPLSVIEIGSKYGGTAVWLADTLMRFSPDGRVYSIDLKPPHLIIHHGVSFLYGDEGDLANVLDWKALPHPWLVMFDASHLPNVMVKGLRFLEQFTVPGDYFIVEDAFVSELGEDQRWNGGPAEAITAFLKSNPLWKIDTALCDYFGYNVTGNPNGYLRRI